MASQTRLQSRKVVKEAGTDTTVAKKPGTDATVANKAVAASYNKEAAKSTQSSDLSLIDDSSDETEEQTNQGKDSGHLAADVKTQSSEDIRLKGDDRSRDSNSVDRAHFFPRLIICSASLLILVAAMVFARSQLSTTSYTDHGKGFESKLRSLQSVLTNQTDRFWKILKNRGLAHIRRQNPQRPLVLLLASPPPAHDVVNCLAEKLAEALDPEHKRNLVQVDGIKVKGHPGEKVKKSMDDLLKGKFQHGHRAAIIQHLELLPPPSPLLFYSYCNDQNAPHKHVAIIFTVHLPSEPDLSLPPKEAEGMVEKYLSNDVWAKENQDSVAALLSHVADTVVLMNGESGEHIKTLCS